MQARRYLLDLAPRCCMRFGGWTRRSGKYTCRIPRNRDGPQPYCRTLRTIPHHFATPHRRRRTCSCRSHPGPLAAPLRRRRCRARLQPSRTGSQSRQTRPTGPRYRRQARVCSRRRQDRPAGRSVGWLVCRWIRRYVPRSYVGMYVGMKVRGAGR